MPRILVIDDDAAIAELVSINLEMAGYEVNQAEDGIKGQALAVQLQPDLVMLDLMLPKVDGFTVCQRLRRDERTADIPVLMLTALGQTQDKVEGFNAGADDYLTKPFNLEELLLRVQKLIGRAAPKSENPFNLVEFKFGNNFINFESFEAKGVAGDFMLTKKEAMLLKLLIENKGQVVSREKILQTVWGYNVYPSTRTIDNFILAFRKYFEHDVKKPVHFQSMRGVGYKFNDVKTASES